VIAHARKAQTSTPNARENAKDATGARNIAHANLGVKLLQMKTPILQHMNIKIRLIKSHPGVLKAVQLSLKVKRVQRARIEVNLGERRRDLGMAGTLVSQ
jgi:hypothetical protein